ncbi:MAG: DUF4910 domain-containing protein [Planctomycetota bacterium]|nr:DUF4910 domain-containing protein [Planctomycetota bacterium]
MSNLEESGIGQTMHDRLTLLYPICRSITGNGVRETLSHLQGLLPLQIHEVPSGTQVFDWVVPNEWNIRDAWIKNEDGVRVLDFKEHSLHVMSYSTPIHQTMPLEQLRKRITSLPDQPDVIPYKTSYYQEDWGFCMRHRDLEELEDGDYEVCIDSILEPGSLTYGEFYLPGQTADEILFSAHVCHPSLANDNLSGVVVSATLASVLAARPQLRYSYRFVFIPGTIGAITWLARNEERTPYIQHGLVLSGLGDAGSITYKQSRQGDAMIDRAVSHVLALSGEPFSIQRFSPYGYDERQYCSPGFNLPVGCFSRSPYGTYPEYHTSNDNPTFVRPESLAGSLETILGIVEVLEGDCIYLNTQPKCEPQLGRRGLYRGLGSTGETMAMLWVLNLADGKATLLEMAERASIPFAKLSGVAHTLESHGLLRKVT